jgi:putative membrane protein
MEQISSDHDRAQLDQRVTEAEKRTKAQIVLAVIKRSDTYAELPWKAFAMGVSVAGLLVIILDLFTQTWNSNSMVHIAVAATLAVGAIFALLTVFVPGFARLFLSANRAEVEVRQYADSIFLSRELFATDKRTGILLLISLFERRVVILPDKGLSNRLSKDAMRDVIAAMSTYLRRTETSRAMEEGLERLCRILEPTANGAEDTKNELPDDIIEENGV